MTTGSILKDICTPGFKFPKQETHDDLKLNVENYISFGDISDASRTKPLNKILCGIIGTINNVRKFFPGKYKVSIIDLYDPANPLVIFHHESVDPNLLAIQVIRLGKDYEDFHRHIRNCINRYDWCNWTHFDMYFDFENEEDDDDKITGDPNNEFAPATETIKSLIMNTFREEEFIVPVSDPEFNERNNTIIYFNKAEQADQLGSFILKKQIQISRKNRYIFSVQDDDGEVAALGIYFTPYKRGEEWEYAKAFQDSVTNTYFALIVNSGMDTLYDPREMGFTETDIQKMKFTTVKETGLKFPMSEFMFNET